MLEHLTELNSEALTSSAVASHVSLTPWLEAARRLVTSVISGERSSALWGKRNPDGSWERTSQDSLALNLEDSSGEWSMTWPRFGTVWDSACMEHPTLERFTAATVSSSLPTPTVEDHKTDGDLTVQKWADAITDGVAPPSSVQRLRNAVLLPTPQAMDCNDRQKSEKWKGDDLVSTIKDLARRGELLPTPQAWDAKDYHAAKPEIVKTREQQKKRGGGCANLAERMAATGNCYAGMGNAHAMTSPYLPTPAASQMGKPIHPLAPSEVDGSHGTMLVGAIGQVIGENGESPQRLGLNPEFVEAMMGLPIGWTDLRVLETP